MKVFPFTILVSEDKSVVSERTESPHFYQFLHRHDEWQITYIERGDGTLIAGNDMQTFKAGELFVIGAKLPHLFKSNAEYFETNQESNVAAHSIYFNTESKLAPLFSLPEMKSAKTFLSKHKHGFKVPAHHVESINSLMRHIEGSSGADLLFTFVKMMLSLQLLDEEVIPICSDMYSANVSESEGVRLSKIVNFITDNYCKAMTLEEVSSVAFMTPQAFCRYFKKHTGHTFISYLNEVRVNYACKNLIVEGNLDHISSIAFKVGFTSIPNFNRVFKTIIGKSPKAYIDDYKRVFK